MLGRVREQMPVGLVDLLDARAHPASEREQAHLGGDRPGRVGVAPLVGIVRDEPDFDGELWVEPVEFEQSAN